MFSFEGYYIGLFSFGPFSDIKSISILDIGKGEDSSLLITLFADHHLPHLCLFLFLPLTEMNFLKIVIIIRVDGEDSFFDDTSDSEDSFLLAFNSQESDSTIPITFAL